MDGFDKEKYINSLTDLDLKIYQKYKEINRPRLSYYVKGFEKSGPQEEGNLNFLFSPTRFFGIINKIVFYSIMIIGLGVIINNGLSDKTIIEVIILGIICVFYFGLIAIVINGLLLNPLFWLLYKTVRKKDFNKYISIEKCVRKNSLNEEIEKAVKNRLIQNKEDINSI